MTERIKGNEERYENALATWRDERKEAIRLRTEVERLRTAILEFLRWENEEPHNEAQWLEALELLAEAAEAAGGGDE